MVTLVHDLETLTSDLGVLMGFGVWLAKWLKIHMVQVSILIVCYALFIWSYCQ